MTNDLLQVLRGQRVDGRTDAEVRAAAAAEIEQLRGNLSLAEDGLAAAMQENQRLKEAVAKFGDHASSCAYRLAHYKGPVPACDCGWNEYVAGLSHEPRASPAERRWSLLTRILDESVETMELPSSLHEAFQLGGDAMAEWLDRRAAEKSEEQQPDKWAALRGDQWTPAEMSRLRQRNRAPAEHEWDADGKCKWCPAERTNEQSSYSPEGESFGSKSSGEMMDNSGTHKSPQSSGEQSS